MLIAWGRIDMSISEALREAMAHRDLSKNEIIRRTGIDRSTFYQIINGRRNATPAQLTAILKHLNLDQQERLHLIQIYERERVGDAVYKDWEQITNFLKRLDHTENNTEEVRSFPVITQAMERVAESENPSLIRFFLPGTLLNSLGIYQDLVRIASQHPDREFKAMFLLAPMIESTVFETVLDNLPELLQLLQSTNLRICAGSVPAATAEFTYITPYPYYILTGDSLILFSEDGSKMTTVNEKSYLQIYDETFQKVYCRAGNVIESPHTLSAMMETISRYFQIFAGQEIIFLTPVPCINLSITDAQLTRYFPDERLLAFKHLLEKVSVTEFTSRMGMQRMLKERSVDENGVHIDILPEDIPILAHNIEERLKKNLYFLIEETVTVPRNWGIYVFGEEILVIVSHNNCRSLITVCNRDITKKFADWFRSRRDMIQYHLTDE